MTRKNDTKPRILAPAGNRQSFLAAVAAGADAVYCGLKSFSARMEAKNFSIPELTALTRLAHDKGVDVYVTLNSMVKTGEIDDAGVLIHQLAGQVRPDAFIVQDLAMVSLTRQAGFKGEIHLSTLANVTTPTALQAAARIDGVRRVVLPRELDIDEIKAMAKACPSSLDLEVFIHGALCYAVSGRCYWSSYLGGKSGLRGRCVQPCRRVYKQSQEKQRYFSCKDLSLDVLVKVLKDVPQVGTWKIEGRKKSPHYVYYTVQAYRMLRDEGKDPARKRDALSLLEMALGRTFTHFNFLPQRPQNPLASGSDTGSGFRLGTVKGAGGSRFFRPRIDMLAGDVIRIGYEDQRGHARLTVRKAVPRNGKFYLGNLKGISHGKGMPVFLTDRREPALRKYIAELESQLPPLGREEKVAATVRRAGKPGRSARRQAAISGKVYRHLPRRIPRGHFGVWLSEASLQRVSGKSARNCWLWLPPVVWPKGEEKTVTGVRQALKKGIRRFVLGAPWQIELFGRKQQLDLWAGPFCNIANELAIDELKRLGFSGAFISPELGRNDVLALPGRSPLPLGVVIHGHWPLCVSRIKPEDVPLGTPFQSPKGEDAWLIQDSDAIWMFPNWLMDLRQEEKRLQKSGYQQFAALTEPIPTGIHLKNRPGKWNWKHDLQ
jgi:putative protease